MKRLLFVLLLCVLVGGSLAAEIRVALTPLGTSGDHHAQAVAVETTRALNQILSQLPRYELGETSVPSGTSVNAGNAARFINNNDFLVFGSVSQRGSETVIAIQAWSRAEQQIVASYSGSIASAFELFDAAEDAAVALMESLTGELIRFGEVRITNTGRPGAYTLLSDGLQIPVNNGVARMLVGSYVIQIHQERMFESAIIAEQQITVLEDRPAQLSFAIPLLTGKEREQLLGIEESITANWNDPDQQAMVLQLFGRLQFLLDDVSYSTDLVEYRQRYADMENDYRQQYSLAATPQDDSPQVSAETLEYFYRQRQKSPLIAGGLSFLLPSAGHFYGGEAGKGLIFAGGETLLGIGIITLATIAGAYPELNDGAIHPYDDELAITVGVSTVALIALRVWEILDSVGTVNSHNNDLRRNLGLPLK